MRAGEPEAQLAWLSRFGDRNKKTVIGADIALLIPRGDETTCPATAMHVNSKRLDRAGNDISAIIAWSGEHAKADGINADDCFGPFGAGKARNFGSTGFDGAKIVRVLK